MPIENRFAQTELFCCLPLRTIEITLEVKPMKNKYRTCNAYNRLAYMKYA